MEELISTQTSRLLSRALDGLSQRHKAIASNIANAETPGYNAMQVNFEENLKTAIKAESNPGEVETRPGSLKTDDPRHINPKSFVQQGGSASGIIERTRFEMSQSNNGVDIENQMAQLTKNAGRYSAISRLEGRTFNTLRAIIKSGG